MKIAEGFHITAVALKFAGELTFSMNSIDLEQLRAQVGIQGPNDIGLGGAKSGEKLQ